MEKICEYKILLVEDSDTDAFIIKKQLKMNLEAHVETFHMASMKEAEAFIKSKKSPIDIILLDLGLPDTKDGQDSFHRAAAIASHTPIIILTSEEDHRLAVDLVNQGAEDYVKKSAINEQPTRLCDVIDFAIYRHRNLTAAQEKIKEKESVISWMGGAYSV